MSSSSKPHFRFKQFSVWHDQCAMKVSTDAVLLGAWSSIPSDKIGDRSFKCPNIITQPQMPLRILDIGTGTGILSLMLAQRLSAVNSNVTKALNSTLKPTLANQFEITAVELMDDAATQAAYNFKQSLWHEQLTVINQDIQLWSKHANVCFNHIICNPPYFTNALKGESNKRNEARHNDNLSFKGLLQVASHLLVQNGTFELILPTSEFELFNALIDPNVWLLSRAINVKHNERSEPIRKLIRLVKREKSTATSEIRQAMKAEKGEIIIRNPDNNYHQSFVDLCKDFYLKM